VRLRTLILAEVRLGVVIGRAHQRAQRGHCVSPVWLTNIQSATLEGRFLSTSATVRSVDLGPVPTMLEEYLR
jgi:hypothetical protein